MTALKLVITARAYLRPVMWGKTHSKLFKNKKFLPREFIFPSRSALGAASGCGTARAYVRVPCRIPSLAPGVVRTKAWVWWLMGRNLLINGYFWQGEVDLGDGERGGGGGSQLGGTVGTHDGPVGTVGVQT